jgi:hypothetical protein
MTKPHVFSLCFAGHEIEVYRSPDGAVVIWIDSPQEDVNAQGEPACRVYLNEALLHEGTPFTDKSAEGA